KTGQATTIILLLAAFVMGESAWWLVAFVALAQLLGALGLPFAPFRLLYMALKRTGLLKPNPQPDHHEPHRFALAVGTVFNAVGAFALVSGAVMFGWVLVWIVIVLANLNFWISFCLGCWFYYRLSSLGVPGFTQSPIQNA
ncbi:MAG: DUF4395 domain-containing protein, partial [Chloroflexota bacterium]